MGRQSSRWNSAEEHGLAASALEPQAASARPAFRFDLIGQRAFRTTRKIDTGAFRSATLVAGVGGWCGWPRQERLEGRQFAQRHLRERRAVGWRPLDGSRPFPRRRSSVVWLGHGSFCRGGRLPLVSKRTVGVGRIRRRIGHRWDGRPLADQTTKLAKMPIFQGLRAVLFGTAVTAAVIVRSAHGERPSPPIHRHAP